MGVFGTFCQICALPVQHNCYVPHGEMYAIYRGTESYPETYPKPAFPFGPEHAWLRKAIGLRERPETEPKVVRGEVQDGTLETTDGGYYEVIPDEGDYLAIHEYCYGAAGEPEWAEIAWIEGSEFWQSLEPYHGQLFDFQGLMDKGLAWITVDPNSDTDDGRRSRGRIAQILKQAKP